MNPKILLDNINIWTSAIETKSTAGRGSNGKINLFGIKKLRELILELAVRGKLVPQNPNDEPASVLLEKIASEKERLIKEGKIKKSKKLPKIGEDENRSSLLKGWSVIRFGEIINLISGQHLKPQEYSDSSKENGMIPYLTGPAEFGPVFPHATRFTKEKRAVAMPKNILITCKGSGVGKLNEVKEETAISRQLMAIQPIIVSTSFVKLIAESIYKHLRTKIVGIAIPGISREDVTEAIILLPPLEEQHRIVAKVDELMSLCDQLEQQTEDSITAHQTLVETLLAALTRSQNAEDLAQNWNRISDHFDTLFTTEHSIDQLKQTILQLAVMGKLVPQNPNDEPASVLLKKIAAEKEKLIKEKKIKKQKPLAKVSDSKNLLDLPEGWEWCRLHNLITVMDAGWSPACPPEPSPSDDKWGVLKTTAVQTMEYRQEENKVLADNKEPKPQYEVESGDILITRAGPKNRVGISCLVEKTRPKLMISDKIIRFHIVEIGMSERYLSLCLNAGVTAEYIEAAKSGMAVSQMNISQDKLKIAPIPICPINEQHQIVAKVDKLMTLCDQLKAQITEVQSTRLQLTDTLVEQAEA